MFKECRFKNGLQKVRLVSVIALSSIRNTLQTMCFLITISVVCHGQLVAQGKTVEEQNKKLIHIAVEEIANKGNLDKISQLFTSDFVQHFLSNGTQTKGLGKFRTRMAQLQAGFPDWAEEIKLMVADKNLVATWIVASGTNTAFFLGIPPTGKKTVHNVMSFFRIADGKIAEQWLLPDLYSMNSHLGLIPGKEATEIYDDVVWQAPELDVEIDSIELQRNEDLALLANEEVWTNGNFERLDKMFSDDFVQYFLPFCTRTDGLEAFREQCTAHREAFPDWTEEVNLVVAEGNYVFLQFTSTGSNTGSFLGYPPTGKIINICEVTIFRFADGKIAEQWLLPDILSLNQQLGFIESSN